MIRKISKGLFKILIVTSILIGLLYGGFHLWEYISGGKFVKYLSNNSETIPLNETFTYEKIGKDIEKKQLILVGEIHGFHEPTKFDIDFFKFLHKNHNVNHYIAELDFVQASLLNDFLITGDEKKLKEILKNWVVIQGRNNKDYFNKYLTLHRYYKKLPENHKFKIIGIDKIQDEGLLKKYLKELYPNITNNIKDTFENKSVYDLIIELETIHNDDPDILLTLSYLKSNVQYIEDKVNREEVMFLNFSKLYKSYNLKEHKLYGYFGLAHVFQYRINGYHPLASKIRQSDLDLEDKIMSVNIMMNDSYMVMPSNLLPGFMSDEGPYTRMPISADNMLFMYIVGIKDFKRMTPKYQKSLIKMDGKNSPYSNSERMNRTIQLLPVTDTFEMTDKGKPYIQYTVFMRNSDWAEPME
ncbi:hypothetical protein [Algibacter sp. L3A6]|uniref:hypothetical protein n=1 Tax=Algibacter sp. L3A6 TaxID=2686366 RepID=UPI00131CE8D4|nr:hypothetical protein [Algibacter sp. L3A6]